MNKIEFGDCRDIMRRWAQEGVKVQTCVTSPPYYGLRDYGTGKWVGGDPECSHKRDSKFSELTITGHKNMGGAVGDGIYKSVCPRCGAVREDQQLGLEETPEQYIANMVEVFRCVKDILADDGTLWVNIGDSYNAHPGQRKTTDKAGEKQQSVRGALAAPSRSVSSCKPKDLIGIPWMLAFALRADGWYLRQDIIWHKPNPMPESVQDRCTKSHEYIFLLSKSPKYFFDNEAIKEPVKQDWGTRDRTNGKYHNDGTGLQPHSGLEKSYGTANKRSVWTVTTKPYSGAHFATFPNDLIEPAILAGTSRNGHCPKCQSRWVRVKEETGERVEVENYTGEATKDYEGNKVQNPSDTKRRVLESMSKVYKHNWIATCECGVDPVPDVVLDPFMGSGTTAQVAQDLGRRFLGCELNPEYKALQDQRLSQMALELA